jgi:hypothetical protein
MTANEAAIRKAYQVAFNCYLSGTVVLSQLGVLQKLEAVLGR